MWAPRRSRRWPSTPTGAGGGPDPGSPPGHHPVGRPPRARRGPGLAPGPPPGLRRRVSGAGRPGRRGGGHLDGAVDHRRGPPGRPAAPRPALRGSPGPAPGTEETDRVPSRRDPGSEREQGKRMVAWAVGQHPGAHGYWNCQAVATHALTGVPAVDVAAAMSFGGLFAKGRWDKTRSGRTRGSMRLNCRWWAGWGPAWVRHRGRRRPSPGGRSTPSASRSWPGPPGPATSW